VRAVGELSLRHGSAQEAEVFERQLRLATSARLPVMVEAPIEMDAFERMLRVVDAAASRGWTDPARICVVDLNAEKLRRARKLGFGGYGIPVSPRVDGPFVVREKLDHREIAGILAELGAEGIMLNSGLHLGYGDPLCLPKTVLRLGLAGVDRDTLRAIAAENALRFFEAHV
jgi:hypothetical protein